MSSASTNNASTKTADNLSLSDLHNLCQRLAQSLKANPQSICLHLIGDLGSGKTTFCQKLLAAIGVEARVKSPTYTLLEPYTWQHWQICHVDLYRLNQASEILHLGLEEYQAHSPLLLLIEWPQQGADLTPPADLSVEFTIAAHDRRNLKLTAHSDKATATLQATSIS